MSYTIYHTEGIVLGFANAGEADRRILVFTEDLGLIRAQVQSVRKEASRHRYSTQQLSRSYIDVIYTNEFWRLVSSELIAPGTLFANSTACFAMWQRCSKLLLKLLPLNEPIPELYEQIRDVYQFLTTHKLHENFVRSLERLLIIRALYLLGYWPITQEEKELLMEPLTKETLHQVVVYVESLLPTINNTLKTADL